jgi:hypothetical protein
MARNEHKMVSNNLAKAGAILGVVIGVGLLINGVHSFLPPASPRPYSIAMLTAGIIECLVCYYALYGSRAAWSFALSLNGVAGCVFVFGATKVRDATELPLAVALVPSVMFGLCTVLLTLASDEYKN